MPPHPNIKSLKVSPPPPNLKVAPRSVKIMKMQELQFKLSDVSEVGDANSPFINGRCHFEIQSMAI